MPRLRLILRLITIQRVLFRHGLDELIVRTHLFRPLRFLFYLSPYNWLGRDEGKPRGVRIREALQELGPIYVKFGQSVSTRQDLLAPDIGVELAKLQDEVPPFPPAQALAEVERAFGRAASSVFTEFDEHALAAASIAQVHAARLPTGEDVVVKILRPQVREQVERDLEVLYALARLVGRFWKESWRLRPVELVAEYEKTILNELDLLREAANAAQLRRNFENDPKIYVPEVYWDYCRANVMVLERIHGIPIDDITALKAAHVNIPRLAANGVAIFFTQVFRDNFFHADMHPGNIFVDPGDPEHPKYCAVDFGIVGTLTDSDRRYLAENFLAFFERDYHRVAQLHVDSRWVPPGTRVDEFESAIRSVCEPVFAKPLKDISFGTVLLRLFQTARQFDMEVQPQLMLLQKTLVQIEGLGRMLYPELDLWQTALPVLKGWVREQSGPRATLRRLRGELPDLRYTLERLPLALRRFVERQADDGGYGQGEGERSHDRQGLPAAAVARQRYALGAGALLVIAGVLFLGLRAHPQWVGWLLGAGGLIVLWSGRPGVVFRK
ncbi:MAG: ubiquinone biosynthesis regulatory protein kinase UbiB [Gammaproteobacteria bacterium]|nr:ubiquinone biosynthesis regulatory protein kinase UbiB [Gammaproteobacteria bacterium]